MADIKVRVGQQNSIKVISSVSGSSNASNALFATNVVGGIASVTQLNVSGISTFVGLSTFKSSVYIDGDLFVSDDLVFDEFTVRSGTVTGILTVNQALFYPPGNTYGVAYFNPSDQLVSTGTTNSAITETNYMLTTNSSGVPTWSSVIDGGVY